MTDRNEGYFRDMDHLDIIKKIRKNIDNYLFFFYVKMLFKKKKKTNFLTFIIILILEMQNQLYCCNTYAYLVLLYGNVLDLL